MKETKKYVFDKLVEKNTYLRNCQLVYLKYICEWKNAKIAEFLDLASSTVGQYARKFRDLLEKAKGLFYHIKEIAKETKEEIVKHAKPNSRIINDSGKELDNDKPSSYIIEILDSDMNVKWFKVGKSTHIADRMKQHLYYKGYQASYIRVCSVEYFDSNEECETAESQLRLAYKEKLGKKNFVRNDRFLQKRYNKNDDIFHKKVGENVRTQYGIMREMANNVLEEVG